MVQGGYIPVNGGCISFYGGIFFMVVIFWFTVGVIGIGAKRGGTQ